MKRRIFRRAAAWLLAAVSLFTTASASAPSLSARSAVVLDGTTGRVLYAHNADEKSLIASTTKIMTGLLITEQCSMDGKVEVKPEAVGIEGSSLYLKAGEVLSVKELLYGLMLRSGNDAAVTLALYCDGSVEAFAKRMNRKAEELGLTATHFANPHGLDSEENYSTALDLARLSAYAMENSLFREIVSTKSVTIGSRSLTNHNKLLWQYDGAVGVKTGYTKAAGRILVSAAEKNGRRLIAVTIHAPNDWQDHKSLLDYGFSAYVSQSIVMEGEPITEVAVLEGTRKTVSVSAKESFSCPLAKEETAVLRLHVPRFVFAPVEEGQTAGYAEILVNGVCIGKLDLYWQESVPLKEKKRGSPGRLFGG